MSDKEIERKRYDDRAAKASKSPQSESVVHCGSGSITPILRAPYTHYEALLKNMLTRDAVVLEIGSGTGEFTGALLSSGANVVASDISLRSLELLRFIYSEKNNLSTVLCDMESLPFSDGVFDAVVCAGSLSYGDNQVVLNHIQRILKPGGCLICVDSLNHNPIYRINLYIHFLLGDRSYSTLIRMPTVDLIVQYQAALGGISSVTYFGGLSWLIVILARFGFKSFWADVSDRFDGFFRVRRSAFKFVLMVRKGL